MIAAAAAVAVGRRGCEAAAAAVRADPRAAVLLLLLLTGLLGRDHGVVSVGGDVEDVAAQIGAAAVSGVAHPGNVELAVALGRAGTQPQILGRNGSSQVVLPASPD